MVTGSGGTSLRNSLVYLGKIRIPDDAIYSSCDYATTLFSQELFHLIQWETGQKTLGKFLPLTYSGDAMSQIILYGRGLGDILPNIGVLLVFLVALTVLNIVGLRR